MIKKFQSCLLAKMGNWRVAVSLVRVSGSALINYILTAM